MSGLSWLAALMFASAMTACTSASASVDNTEITPAAVANLPPGVVAAARAAMPGMTLVRAELKVREGRRYYDVEGKLPNGSDIELDMLEKDGAWLVVEIQRDIAWSATPAPVRAVAASQSISPVRVIESRQTDGRVIYELFAPGRPGTPAAEVMLANGTATILTETWPH